MSNDKLNKRELEFVRNYIKEPNGTKAAQNAGYSPDNRQAAAVSANRLLKKAKIRAEIDRQQSMILHEVRSYFISDALAARKTLHTIMNDSSAPIKERRQAAVEILDRAMGKANQPQQIKLDATLDSVNVHVNADMDEYDELFDELAEVTDIDDDEGEGQETE